MYTYVQVSAPREFGFAARVTNRVPAPVTFRGSLPVDPGAHPAAAHPEAAPRGATHALRFGVARPRHAGRPTTSRNEAGDGKWRQ